MSVYEVRSFKGAISDWEDKGILGAFKFGWNLDIRKDIDSLSCNQDFVDEGLESSQSPSLSVSPSATPSESPSVSVSPSPSTTAGESPSPSATPSVSGSATPSSSASASVSLSPSPSAGLTTVFADLIRTFVKCSDGYTYGFGSTGYVYRRDNDAFWQIVYKDPDGEIKGAEEMPTDSGKTYLGWCTNTKVKRKPIPGLSNWNDVEVVAQNLSSQDYHTMKQIGGATFIANGPYLAMVGYDESYTNEALDLIPGNLAKTIVERDGRSIIGTVKSADPTRGVNGAIDAEVPLAQVGSDGELYFANGSSSVATKKFPGGGKVNPGGVCNEIDQVNFFEWDGDALSWIDKQSVGNMALFAVYSATTGYGGVYSYGRKNKNKDFVMNLDYLLDVDELGAIVNIEGTTLVSYRDGTDFGVKAEDSAHKATGIYEGLDFKAPVKKPVNITTWKYVELFCDPLVLHTSLNFWYRVNKNGDWVQAKMENGSASFSATGEKKAVFLIGAEGEIFEPRVGLNPYVNTSPIVHRIRVYFE
jgi:hypothetical protein